MVHKTLTTSTMDDARDLEASGAPDGSLVWADRQTDGRGRVAGRTWADGPGGASLLFTVFWRPERFRVPTFAPSLVVGLGVARWVASLGLEPQLKWPNDLWLGGRKAGGILVRRPVSTRALGSLHAGIGINLRAPEAADLGDRATDLAAWGRDLTPAEALTGVLGALEAALNDPDPRRGCEAFLLRSDGVLGLDDQGALWKQGPEGPYRVTMAP